MKKSIIIFLITTVLSVGMIICGCVFVSSHISEVTITEETITGNREIADGLTVGFRADSSNNLHWVSSFNFSTDKTKSVFSRGEMTKKIDTSVYDPMRFTGWSVTPFTTQLRYDRMNGLQGKAIQAYYNKIQKDVKESGVTETGKIRLKDYMEYYPISFRFQLGTKIYNSQNALTGLKVYSERNILDQDKGATYDGDVDLYVALNNIFKIPVLANEYQEYKVSKLKDYDYNTELSYKTDIVKPVGEGEDYYEFDPVIALQEENIKDGQKWYHPDLLEGNSNDLSKKSNKSKNGEMASDYNLKNRILFIINTKTVKGASVDVSQIKGGFGVYEIPINVLAIRSLGNSRRNRWTENPVPQTDKIRMVYPLNKEAEYVEISISKDHRYVAIFSVNDGYYYVDIVDADMWTSKGNIKLFPASDKMTYTWGKDGSLAVTNHNGYVAAIVRTDEKEMPYKVLYSGKTGDNFDKAFFDDEMVAKKNSYSKYKYGIDSGLAIAASKDKIALAQNTLVGNKEYSFRNAALECAVIDRSGVIYRGRLENNIVDLQYSSSDKEVQTLRSLIKDEDNSKIVNHMIKPVRNENWIMWDDK